MIDKLFGYEFSNDYEQLWVIAHRQSVACVVSYNEPVPLWLWSDRLISGESCNSRDICQTISTPNAISVSVRGCTYISASKLKDFIAQCERCKLEWIVPASIIPHAGLPGGGQPADATP